MSATDKFVRCCALSKLLHKPIDPDPDLDQIAHAAIDSAAQSNRVAVFSPGRLSRGSGAAIGGGECDAGRSTAAARRPIHPRPNRPRVVADFVRACGRAAPCTIRVRLRFSGLSGSARPARLARADRRGLLQRGGAARRETVDARIARQPAPSTMARGGHTPLPRPGGYFFSGCFFCPQSRQGFVARDEEGTDQTAGNAHRSAQACVRLYPAFTRGR
jgi:hypothetical protein